MDNEILKYTSKDYTSIYNDLLNAIPALTDLWTSKEDGDPGIVLLKLISSLGDMLSFNMDKQALEYYASTVTQRKNAAKLFNLIGYKMHWYQSATNQIDITNNVPIPTTFNVVTIYNEYKKCIDKGETEKAQQLHDEYIALAIATFPESRYPQYYTDGRIDENKLFAEDSEYMITYFTWLNANTLYLYTYIANPNRTLDVRGNDRSNNYYIIKPTTYATIDGDTNVINADVSILPGETQSLDVIQGTLCSTKFNSLRMRNNRYYFSESTIDGNNMWLSYDATETTSKITDITFIDKTDNLLTVSDGKIYFEFNVDEFDMPYIELSSYWVDTLGDSVNFTVYYVRTDGVYGNITKNFLTNIEGLPRKKYTINHPSNNTPFINDKGRLIAIPGKHPETAHQAYLQSLNYVTTFDTLVTIYDFERFCKRQVGISNAIAIDGQRANDINADVIQTANSMSLAQLQSYYDESTQNTSGTIGVAKTIEDLRAFYISRKRVNYSDYDGSKEYLPYGLNLHIVYGNFDTYMQDTDYKIASIETMNELKYWTYKIQSNYSETDESIGGQVAKYLDEKLRETKIVNVVPEYAAVRVFPWRCCGTIHLKNPVSKSTANKILETVMSHLRYTFNPANIEFGKKINYIDVINAVTDAHDMIRYFDAGVGNRKLIDIDKSVDYTYFNSYSMMYYVQTMDGFEVEGTFIDGNNKSTKKDSKTPNPYYNMLSIAPEYIIE